jgi:hypothetical protein
MVRPRSAIVITNARCAREKWRIEWSPQKTALGVAIGDAPLRNLAERQGFEPWIPCGIRDFESRAFDHSAISPQARIIA